MQYLDRIKIVVDTINCVELVDYNQRPSISICGHFTENKRLDGTIESTLFVGSGGFLLRVFVGQADEFSPQCCFIEFSSKILVGECYRMISWYTIKKCLTRVRSFGIFKKFDVDAIMQFGRIVRIDVDENVVCKIGIRGVCDFISAHMGTGFYTSGWLGNGMKIMKSCIVGKDAKRDIMIYDKEQELKSSSTSISFRKILTAEELARLSSIFKNVVRFELHLYSTNAIKKALKVQDTKIETILKSDARPIVEYLGKLLTRDILSGDPIKDTSFMDKLSIREAERLYILSKFGYDTSILWLKLKRNIASSTKKKDYLNSYESVLGKVKSAYPSNRTSQVEHFMNRLFRGRNRCAVILRGISYKKSLANYYTRDWVLCSMLKKHCSLLSLQCASNIAVICWPIFEFGNRGPPYRLF